ncbi:MAG: rRNA maturation RNase YbeY [Burkholderiales bacterium]|nr:rRNA maturation RNase YbeY [Burkholderiales bacterium]
MSANTLVHVGYAVPRAGVPSAASFRRWVEAALRGAKRRRATELSIRLVDADEGRALNRDWRGRDYATNVLTFDYEHAPQVVADLVLCAPVVEAEARAQGLALADHYAHLLVHGTLHAQGYDHEAEAEAQAMEARESAILRGLGLADPYAG